MSLWRRILVERRSVVLPLALLIAVNLVVLIAVVLPLRQSVAGADTARRTSTTDFNMARRDLMDAQRTAESRKQATEGLQKFNEQVLSSNYQTARNAVLFWSKDTAMALGLVPVSIDTSAPIEVRDSRLMQVSSQFTLRGSYAAIRKFLFTVEAAEQFLVVDRIKVAQPGVQQGNSQSLEFEVTITSFYLGGRQ
jgi:hypothetical protein